MKLAALVLPSARQAVARRQAAVRAVRSDLGEFSGKAGIVAMFTYLVVRLGNDFIQTGRLTALLLLIGEALVILFTIFRRDARLVDRSAWARALTSVSVAGPLMVLPSRLPPLAPDVLTAAVSAIGLLVVLVGKVSLGRSFGVMPAHRGLKSSGLYAVVRHPIYMGGLITHVAFVAANPIAWNLVVLVIADVTLMARAVCEERTLACDPEYVAYAARVKWRVIPGLF